MKLNFILFNTKIVKNFTYFIKYAIIYIKEILMTKTVYYNYLIAENESIIKTLSDLGFSGKYEVLDGKLYVYFQKDGENLSVPKIGKVSNKEFRKILDNKVVFCDGDPGFEEPKLFDANKPSESFISQALYIEKINKLVP